MAGRTRETALAVLGLATFGTVVIVFGALRDPAGTVAPVAGPAAIAPTAQPNAAALPAVPAPVAQAAPRPEPARPEPVPQVSPPQGSPPQASPPQASPPQAPVPQAPREAAAPIRPSFDIVRVEPTGESVIAGRGEPDRPVELLRDGVVHDRAVADAAGAFALVPPPLPPGTSELSLRVVPRQGEAVISEQGVTVVVAPRGAERPIVALASPGRPTEVVSAPPPAAARPIPPQAAPEPASKPAESRPAATVQVRVETVEAEEGGQLYVSGRATPGATVRLYLNDTAVASGTATVEGRVSFSIRRGVTPGAYRVRLDETQGGTGTVRSRAEVAFAMPVPPAVAQAPARPDPAPPPQPARTAETPRPAPQAAPSIAQQPVPSVPAAPPAPGPTPAVEAAAGRTVTASADPGAPVRDGEPGLVVVPQVNTAIVSRGDSLWRISRRIYGQGLRYTVIYDANQEQIRNPSRIYPGQVFVLPGEGAR